MRDATGPAGAGLLTMIDRALGVVGFVFLQMPKLSLGVMTLPTAATILLRPFDITCFWIWPWTGLLRLETSPMSLRKASTTRREPEKVTGVAVTGAGAHHLGLGARLELVCLSRKVPGKSEELGEPDAKRAAGADQHIQRWRGLAGLEPRQLCRRHGADPRRPCL
ncbi:MAG: hypothetical protein HWE37_11000 [Rhodobacteraceae bacterium]|uniref:hypothetical protein n=1 Tax=Salipiger sp. HF18 TaxID=2721557 RepID=UPI00142DEFD2|nr:hypothetical protein [Salipiger sp. HF18]NIY97795.1 hypothetical protein [Salipiger sp. HF18]NVK60586.1 hypothetical protein [Paracoccaceae bacterium]